MINLIIEAVLHIARYSNAIKIRLQREKQLHLAAMRYFFYESFNLVGAGPVTEPHTAPVFSIDSFVVAELLVSGVVAVRILFARERDEF